MKGNNIIVEKLPEKEAAEKFWKDIWQNEASFNYKAEWLQQIEKTYCRNVTATNYKIDRKMLDKVMKKIQINKASGNDLINGCCYKNLTATEINYQFYLTNKLLPTWLSVAHTVLLPQNTDTHIAKNYRATACLNVMYKLYSSCIN